MKDPIHVAAKMSPFSDRERMLKSCERGVPANLLICRILKSVHTAYTEYAVDTDMISMLYVYIYIYI